MTVLFVVDGGGLIQLGFLKILLAIGVQVHTKALHVLAEFGRYPLHVTWQSQAAKYLQRLESLSSDGIHTTNTHNTHTIHTIYTQYMCVHTIAQAFITDSKLPKKLSLMILAVQTGHPASAVSCGNPNRGAP